MLLKLAFLNILRNRKRTIITFSGIAISLGLLVIARGMMVGIGSQSERNLINYQTAHFRVSLPGYDEKKKEEPLDYLWADYDHAIQVLSAQENIEAVTARLRSEEHTS